MNMSNAGKLIIHNDRPEGRPDKIEESGRHVEITPLGDVDRTALSVIAANIQIFTGLPADVIPALPIPDYALVPGRMQYNALPIVKSLASETRPRSIRLGVMSDDLCLPIMTYVFGEAQLNGRAAVISLYRLREQRNAKPDLFLERTAKTALHETAHVLGLKHCGDPGCLMSFSMGLEQIDALPIGFCPECTRFIKMKTKEKDGAVST